MLEPAMSALHCRNTPMTILIAIPARAGSKGVPGKNLRAVGGASLVARAVIIARRFIARAGLIDAVVFVDTDDEAIAAEGRLWGAAVPFLRAPALAGDEVSTVDTVLGALDRWRAVGREFNEVLLLQPTSPLREVKDVESCWMRFSQGGSPSVVGIVPAEHPIEQALRLAPDGSVSWAGAGPGAAIRRQDLSAGWWVSGAVYVVTTEALRRERTFVRPGVTIGVPLPRRCALDVDTAEDLAIAEAFARANLPAPVSMMGQTLGGGAPCFVIAEAGVNHNGDISLAHRLVDVAADAGAHAVKFQTFNPETLASPDAPKAEYQIDPADAGESQLSMLQRLTLPPEGYRALQAHASERGILFLSTAFDPASADFLERDLDIPAFKVPSGELTNHAFLEYLALKGRPLLVSTGMARLDEVGSAIAVIEAAGGRVGALFHCVTNYPAAPEDCNLRAMATMRAAFGLPVGWSDHTEGIELSLAAVAAGAEILEKHFTIDRTLPGPDHVASLEPEELRALMTGVRRVEAAMGDGIKVPRSAEVPLAAVARRSLHATRALSAGTILAAADLTALRPGTGISAARLGQLLGRRLVRAVPLGAMLHEADLG